MCATLSFSRRHVPKPWSGLMTARVMDRLEALAGPPVAKRKNAGPGGHVTSKLRSKKGLGFVAGAEQPSHLRYRKLLVLEQGFAASKDQDVVPRKRPNVGCSFFTECHASQANRPALRSAAGKGLHWDNSAAERFCRSWRSTDRRKCHSIGPTHPPPWHVVFARQLWVESQAVPWSLHTSTC